MNLRSPPATPTASGSSLARGLRGMFLVLALLVAGCAKGTYLEVHFTGSPALIIQAIRVELTLMPPNAAPLLYATDTVRPGGRIQMPTSMAFKLDDETGALRVTATALGELDLALANDAKTTAIMTGETWRMMLNFGP